MQRILLGATLVMLLCVSSAIGIALADWPYLKRLLTLPQDAGEWPDSYYQPVHRIRGTNGHWYPIASAAQLSVEPTALEAAARWAAEHNSVALIVLHKGHVQLERYWQGMTDHTLFSGRAMSRSLIGFAYGFAVADGVVDLDDPAQQFIAEWRDEPRGRITVRQLLQNLSGLEELPGTPGSLLGTYFSKNSRLSLGTDFAAAALSFELAHEPGGRFAFSNANAQILGVILERATGEPFERYVEQRLWQPIGARSAELYLDRPGGMPAVYCCFRANARDFARLGSLLLYDGAITLDGVPRQVLPHGWVAQMATTTPLNSLYGMQIWAGRARAGRREYVPGTGQGVDHGEDYLADDVIWMEGGGGRTVWAIPSRELLIVRLGRAAPGWDASALPNMILRGLR
jgi:CubicO group peptidase (beta-lactamase class C family)